MFNPDDLIESAVRKSGLTNFGSGPWREGLVRLCAALGDEAGLNAAGIAMATAELTGTLVERLKVEEHYRLFPETERQQVSAPLMVMGLPRSGTTALSHMLSQDPGNRSIRRWEAARPTPAPDPKTEAQDERIAETKGALERQYAAMPEMMAINPITVDDPSENLCFLRLTFQSLHFGGFYRIPTYVEWALTQDMEPVYRYFARVLKILQLNYPGLRWNLKYPFDLYSLQAIGKVFPDARLIWTHRNPVKSVPSCASFINSVRRPYVAKIDKIELGRTEEKQREIQLRRGLDYRQSAGALKFVDVHNADLIRKPKDVIRDLYDKLKMPYSDAFDAALTRYVATRPIGRFGVHQYTLEEYGLEKHELADRFAFYTDSFSIAP